MMRVGGTRRYAVRPARAHEPSRWTICEDGLPNAVVRSGYLTRWGAMRTARRWTRRNEASRHMEAVR